MPSIYHTTLTHFVCSMIEQQLGKCKSAYIFYRVREERKEFIRVIIPQRREGAMERRVVTSYIHSCHCHYGDEDNTNDADDDDNDLDDNAKEKEEEECL
ncbi:unnamed protein product [Echinostoma caproni]|uniref:ADF-H domain-containing protein n=1 Tax=Echinostoma caproni TaxID=27848 RepID=A0A183A6S8_9TREM|nr:unnamed protein product [Echinostoma caproni]